MSDISCAKCGEPWDAYGVNNGDMTTGESTRFKKGQGCPCCHFGTVCPTCTGSGKYRDCGYGRNECGFCVSRNGTAHVWQPANGTGRYLSTRWYCGYSPNVRVFPLGGDSPKMVTIWREKGHMCADGYVNERVIRCPECYDKTPDCDDCNGTGKFQTPDNAEEIELEAARSHLEASDEEPIGILIERGLQ